MRIEKSFYNTIHLTGEALKQAIDKAKSQEARILIIFQERKGSLLNPHHVHMIYTNLFNDNTPLTSIRRAMNGLTNKGFLLKSDSASSKGSYGASNHVWTLNTAYKWTQAA